MPGGYGLNPLERENIQDIIQHAGSGVDPGLLFSLLQGTVEGAQQRRSENVAARRSIAAELRDRAMTLASQGASEDAVTAALSGMAEASPLGAGARGDERVGRLMNYVGGLYGEGPVSGLAPADYRAQFDTTGIDEEDRAAVGTLVLQGMQKGIPFRDIAQSVRQQAVATGQDELTTQALMGEAETAYERLIGTSLEEMRSQGDVLRGVTEGQVPNFVSNFAGETGIPEEQFGGIQATGVEGLLAQAVNDPRLWSQLQNWRPEQVETPEERGALSMMLDPSTWFFQG